MIRLFRNNGSTGTGMEIPSFFLFFLILLCFSLPAESIPSRSPQAIYNGKNPFKEKFILNIDNGLMTLITRNNSLGPVLDEISRRSDLNVKISPALRSKKITVRWKGVSFEEGLKRFAEDSGLLFQKNEDGKLSLSEEHPALETDMQFINTQEKATPVKSVSSRTAFSQNKDSENSYAINEMVIRFKQDIPEQDINKFLSDVNIKVKKYITALHYHILALPDGMTYYDAMVLFKNNKMIYQAEPDYLIPVK